MPWRIFLAGDHARSSERGGKIAGTQERPALFCNLAQTANGTATWHAPLLACMLALAPLLAADTAAMTPPPSKRAKVELLPTGEQPKEADIPVVPSVLSAADVRPLLQCLPLLLNAAGPTASSSPTGNSITKMRDFFCAHGFRTSLVTAPREGLSIYLDSVRNVVNNSQEQQDTQTDKMSSYLMALLGLHPDQNALEQCYSTTVREVYCMKLFCQHVRLALGGSGGSSSSDEKAGKLLATLEGEIDTSIAITNADITANLVLVNRAGTDSPNAVASSFLATINNLQQLASSAPKIMSSLIHDLGEAEHNLRPDQLQREYDSIRSHNSTYANALMQLFLETHRCSIKEIQLRRSHLPKYERLTLFLYDPNIDETKPPTFTFLPSLRRIIDDGVEAVVDQMVESFWNRLVRLGYFATSDLKHGVSSELRQYFLLGLTKDTSLPFLLNANFTPRYPLSLYLHGKAGIGKSSFVRFCAPALEEVIEEFCDPGIACRFVKQNLNKQSQTLERELELRPNNNDMSIMSIIQGRRMTAAQQKPGLVVVGLEELASDEADADPNQTKTCQLLSQRFSGRKSNYREGEGASQPRNAGKRGISGDSSLIVIFTSNYDLSESAQDALSKLEMFQNLKAYEATPLSGDDRAEFAKAFIQQCICNRLGRDDKYGQNFGAELSIPVGQGDIRCLVRELRILSLFAGKLLSETGVHTVTCTSPRTAKIAFDAKSSLTTIAVGEQVVHLQRESMDTNLYPFVDDKRAPLYFDSRSGPTMAELQRLRQSGEPSACIPELGHIFDYYYTRALTPAVVVSKNARVIKDIVAAFGVQKDVNVISDVDPEKYRMVRSLYDPAGTQNLRDDILNFGRGSFVVVEMTCKSMDAQLLVREMIEDTPSRSAFSSNKSALAKEGLLFALHVDGEVTPEIRSRASIIL